MSALIGQMRRPANFNMVNFELVSGTSSPPSELLTGWTLTTVVRLPEYLFGRVKNYFQEWYRHCEEHPDVDHLDIRSHRQALGKP